MRQSLLHGSTGTESSESESSSVNNTPVSVDPHQILFKTSSLALLRAKHGNESTAFYQAKTPSDRYIAGAKRVLEFMYNMWTKNRLCDVRITTDDNQVFTAHKVALGAYSNRLLEEFNNHTNDKAYTLNVSGFTARTIGQILNFIYTTNLELTDDNIESMIGCSLALGIDLVTEICQEYLGHYDINSALFYHAVAIKYEIEDLAARIYDFICSRFVEITKTRQYSRAPVATVKRLLDEDRLNVSSEMDVFLAALTWLEYRREERLSLAPTLVRSIRMQLLSPEMLVTRLEVVDFIFSLPACHAQLYQALKYHALKLSGSKLHESLGLQTPRAWSASDFIEHPNIFNTPNTWTTKKKHSKSRSSKRAAASAMVNEAQELLTPTPIPPPADEHQVAPCTPQPADEHQVAPCTPQPTGPLRYDQSVLVAVGGINLETLDQGLPGKCMYGLDTATGQWGVLSTLPDYTHHHGVVAIGDFIYVIGGALYNPDHPDRLGSATNSTYMYDSRTSIWRQMAPMKECRAYLAVTTDNGKIYAMGGEDDDRMKLDSVECYDIARDTWTYLARMPGGGKIGMTCAIWQGALYVVGGYSRGRLGNPVLPDVECFDLSTMRWMAKRPLGIPRCHANLVVVCGGLYLVGGRTRLDGPPATITSLSGIDVYDENTDTWRRVADLRVPRHDAGCAVIGSQIYVVGGMKTPSPFCLSSVECYDVMTGRWQERSLSLPHAAAGAACCSLDLTVR